MIWLSLSGLLSKQRVNFLFYPVLIVRSVRSRRLLEHQAAQIRQLIDEIEKLADVIGDGRAIGIQPLQVLLENLADSLHALVYRFEVAVSPGFRFLGWLDEENGMRHLLRGS